MKALSLISGRPAAQLFESSDPLKRGVDIRWLRNDFWPRVRRHFGVHRSSTPDSPSQDRASIDANQPAELADPASKVISAAAQPAAARSSASDVPSLVDQSNAPHRSQPALPDCASQSGSLRGAITPELRCGGTTAEPSCVATVADVADQVVSRETHGFSYYALVQPGCALAFLSWLPGRKVACVSPVTRAHCAASHRVL